MEDFDLMLFSILLVLLVVGVFVGRAVFSSARRQKSKAIAGNLSSTTITSDSIKDLIKDKNQLDLGRASESLYLSQQEIKNVIYALIGDNKLQGTFDGSTFITQSGLDALVQSLDEVVGRAQLSEKDNTGKSKKV